MPPASTDDLLTVQADTIGAVSALAATGAPSPDLTIDVGTFGVFAGMLFVGKGGDQPIRSEA